MPRHPYQIICICRSEHFGRNGLLLAACGPNILSVNLQDGSTVSQWPAEDADNTPERTEEAEEEGPPGKKRKLDQRSSAPSNVIKLSLSPDQRYAVAVTGDDKCVRVFEIESTGKLTELTQRCMPKRPCAILVTPDNQTIICGDKFGDVYSLPLLVEADGEATESSRLAAEPRVKAFMPTATVLTVHSARNRKALESQLRQKDLQAKAKEPLKFKHQLLLGHVSMLTDVHFATSEIDGRIRSFIITSDRDEHIRISRGPPHAYVIERYCLGHKEFISKLCLLPASGLLVSGGGDDWLGFWDWQTGALKRIYDIKSGLRSLLEKTNNAKASDEDRHIAVSGLWFVPSKAASGSARQDLLLVASERCPALVAIFVKEDGSISEATVLDLPGNPLDVAVVDQHVIVSLDAAEPTPPLHVYSIQTSEDRAALVVDNEFAPRLGKINDTYVTELQSDAILYGIENLRKRAIEEGLEAE